MQIGAFKTDRTMSKTIVRVNDLSVRFKTIDGEIQALSNVSFDLKEGEILGIIGESGSGKSTLATAMMSLLPDNASVGGEVRFVNRISGGLEDEEVVTSAETSGRAYFKLRKSSRRILDMRLTTLRWKSIAMVFQGAMNSLNPVYTVRKQILGVVGESGSGKTTLGRTILMTLHPTSGKIMYSYQSDGKPTLP